MVELGYILALELGKRSGVGARLQKIPQMQSGVGARMQEDAAARGQLQTRGGRKNNKALIKAGNLKGLLGYPTYKLFESTSEILKIEGGKIC